MKIRGIQARLHAIGHKIAHPTHKVFWRVQADKTCDGDIICDTCQRIYWCRFQDLSHAEQDRRVNNQ